MTIKILKDENAQATICRFSNSNFLSPDFIFIFYSHICTYSNVTLIVIGKRIENKEM